MTCKEMTDQAGRVFCDSLAISQDRQYTGYSLYTRWYGYYRLTGGFLKKMKLYRSNEE